jgi:hypothetical protein
MNTNELKLVLLPSVINDFEEHIKPDYNKRVLFSAKFGAGKSTFLNNFFLDKEDQYIVLKLFPVNYAVASNEDVFELIKYDLFSELLAKYADKLDMKAEDYSTLLVAKSFALTDLKLYPFIKALLKAAVPNGKEVIDVVDAAKDIYHGFNEYKSKIERGEIDVVNDYISWCEQRKGTIYERDEITSLIAELISRVKSKLDNKQVILIIDDLDRLDPEHVFRLFNMFSAHYDSVVDTNKFGLDKVIFVCDYFNILLMYKHRYGDGVDFEGYINKFYSIKPYSFNTAKHLLESIEDLLLKKPTFPDLSRFKNHGAFDRSSYIVRGLVVLFRDLIIYNLLNFRNLEQFKEYFILDYRIRIDRKEFHASIFPFITFINLITQAISLSSLEKALLLISNTYDGYSNDEFNERDQSIYVWLIQQSLYLLVEGDKLSGNSPDGVYQLMIKGKLYTYTLTHNHDLELGMLKMNMAKETKFNAHELILEAIQKGKKLNLFSD